MGRSALTGRGADLGGTHRRFGLGRMLVVSQVALSLVLLIGAGLFVRSLRNAQAVNPGFITDNILLAGFHLGRERMDRSQGVNFQRQLVERASSLPGSRKSARYSIRPTSSQSGDPTV